MSSNGVEKGSVSPPTIPFPQLSVALPPDTTLTPSTPALTTPDTLPSPTPLTLSRPSRSRRQSKSMNDTNLAAITTSKTGSSTTTSRANPSAPPALIPAEDLSSTIHRLRSCSPPPSLQTVRERRQSIKQERREIITMLRDRTASRAADLGVDVDGLRNLERDGKGECVFVADKLGRRRTSLSVTPVGLGLERMALGDKSEEVIEEESDGKASMSRSRARTCAAVLGKGGVVGGGIRGEDGARKD